jgi:hypothetical protein
MVLGTKIDMKTNGIEDSEINSQSYSQMILNKAAKRIH